MADTSGLQHLVLIGAGAGHWRVLESLAQRRSVRLSVTVVSPNATPANASLVGEFVAGRLSAEACQWSLTSLAQRCGARRVLAGVRALEPDLQRVVLSNGETLRYDWLSVNLEPETNRERLAQQIPGALEHALNLWPLPIFFKLLPQLVQLSTRKPLNIGVVGGGVAAVEVALALHHRLATASESQPSRVSLVTGGEAALANCPAALQQRVLALLKHRQITVLRDRCVGIGETELLLASGARLACDAPVLAIEAAPPNWMGSCGLALGEAGLIAVDDQMRSTSHPRVFAVGQASNDNPDGPQQARHEGERLAQLLRAALDGVTVSRRSPARNGLDFITIGDRQAIVSWRSPWGAWVFEGSWVWRWRQWHDARNLPHTGLPGPQQE